LFFTKLKIKMAKSLIIAEKPSVASDIAKALGGFTKHGDYYESDKYIISSAIGHLLELSPTKGSEVPSGKWQLDNLPVIPPEFDLKPIEDTEARLKTLVKLIKRPDVTELINACDAGREGELIFRFIVKYSGSNKPIKRLWLQSMTPAAIREGFQNLRDDASMKPLADAAICRCEADWLVGINSTRAMTAVNSKPGGFNLTTVGRVQTPTLAIVVEREEKIRNFVPRDYWEVEATFLTKDNQQYTSKWFNPNFPKDSKQKNGDSELKPDRLWERAQAEQIQKKCLQQTGIVSEESKPTTQISPLLFDLTSLQREANIKFGFSANRTLKTAQSLYEKHKVLTYPRTDSRALPEDYIPQVKKTLQGLTSTGYKEFCETILKNGWVKPNKRIFNNSKVSDHFAIIPTGLAPKNLNEDESKIFDLVSKRFLAVFYPPAEYLVTTRITVVKDESFKVEGKVITNLGWLAVYGRELNSEDSPPLPPITQGDQVKTVNIEIKSFQTKPPPRYTEATLLSAMEGAGKLIEDDELREAMQEKGLGTPATRAAIIEGLISEKYIIRQGKELVPTSKAFSLTSQLRNLDLIELCKPELTGNWEFKLKQIEKGLFNRPAFMTEISELTKNIVNKIKKFKTDITNKEAQLKPLEVPCPKCGGQILEKTRQFVCQTCDFSIWTTIASRPMSREEVIELIKNKSVGPLDGFRSRHGKLFSAILRLTNSYTVQFDFSKSSPLQPDQSRASDQAELLNKPPIGKCPKCKSNVYEDKNAYICEASLSKVKKCNFRSSKVILQQPITPEQMKKLLNEGKTDLLPRFISKKGKPFAARLFIKETGDIGFEFQNSTANKDKTAETNKTSTPTKPKKTKKSKEKSETSKPPTNH